VRHSTARLLEARHLWERHYPVRAGMQRGDRL
jgi:hypothetical protein